MAESLDVTFEGKELKNIFSAGETLFDELEETSLPFSSADFQNKVKQSIECFEDATRIVSEVGMFSPNELIDEVSTESVQYLLLPFYLGKLTLKLNTHERLEILKVAEVYFNDFLKRCNEYELCDNKNVEVEKSQVKEISGNSLASLLRAANSRNEKIALYSKKKQLISDIKNLKEMIKIKDVDEEVKREFYLKLIRKSIIDATEEVDSVNLEKKMAEMRKTSALLGEENTSSEHDITVKKAHNHHGHTHGKQNPKPLRPFIITRDATQKAVFGMGYPSLPIMTVDEFYTQRVEDGIFPDEEKVAKMNIAQAIAAAQDPNEKEDQEKAVLEEQIENDDPDNLARMRRMDEYKDVVRRGDGNRYNRS
ncbi:immunoglobulin-binding protein 1 [Teleopsis dalmanni]|uniref:immunoglobulin-binding protein 1 n=1 Tax=Teleopsis dalmanni TaxID=139649 RepID=UPI0018CE8B9C|nr:immunoglobulin-binding protein 1 [Teleopsis dalmanni]